MMITMSFPIYGVEPGSDNHKRITSTLMKAADLHHGVDHPNILTYYGIVRDGAFPALPKYILNELASCDLESYLRTQWSKGGLPLPLLLAIAEDVMAALVCFHGHRLPILHSGVRVRE